MVVAPLPSPSNNPQIEPAYPQVESNYWVRVAAGGTLLAGALLLLNGKRRAGLLAAASGTALALLDQQEILHSWWKVLPILIDDAALTLNRVENVVEDLSHQRDKLRRLFWR